jgi:hypothetical protein
MTLVHQEKPDWYERVKYHAFRIALLIIFIASLVKLVVGEVGLTSRRYAIAVPQSVGQPTNYKSPRLPTHPNGETETHI